MQTLFEYLYKQETKRGEERARFIRWIIAGCGLGASLFYKDYPIAAGSLIILLFNFIYPKIKADQKAIPYAGIFLESLLMTLILLRVSAITPESAGLSPVLWGYFLLLYTASMRYSSYLILFSGILNIAGMNSVYLYRYLYNPDVFYSASGFYHQLLRTGFYLAFALLLLNRPRVIRRILKNQQDFFEKVRTRHGDLLSVCDTVAGEAGLSPRETEVLKELIKGKTYRMIADGLCISQDTVKTHIKNLYRKLDVSSRNELLSSLEGKSVISGESQE